MTTLYINIWTWNNDGAFHIDEQNGACRTIREAMDRYKQELDDVKTYNYTLAVNDAKGTSERFSVKEIIDFDEAMNQKRALDDEANNNSPTKETMQCI